MKRLVAGGLALGFAAVGTLALAGPAGAQEDDFEYEEILLQGTISPTVVAPGGEVTAASVDSCTVPDEGEPGEIYWVVWGVDEFEEPAAEDSAPLEADGSWSVTFAAPGDPGDYEFYALCLPGDLEADEEETLESLASEAPSALGYEEEPEGEEPEGEDVFTYEYYGPLPFEVEGDDGSETPAPPAAQPAQPVVDDPTYTG